MDLFPIGTITDSHDYGTIDSINYYIFEPNDGSRSQPTYNILVSAYQDQTKLTRKKSEARLSITYKYKNIFQKEYQQIEHFTDAMDDALTSFYAIDWSRGRKPTSVTNTLGVWTVAIDNTRLYSTLANQKANYALLWDGSSYKMGTVTTITAGTSIEVTVAYGNLAVAAANSNAYLYPVYCVYFMPGVLSSFEPTEYLPESINLTSDGGWMKSGNLIFTSKYST